MHLFFSVGSFVRAVCRLLCQLKFVGCLFGASRWNLNDWDAWRWWRQASKIWRMRATTATTTKISHSHKKHISSSLYHLNLFGVFMHNGSGNGNGNGNDCMALIKWDEYVLFKMPCNSQLAIFICFANDKYHLLPVRLHVLCHIQ